MSYSIYSLLGSNVLSNSMIESDNLITLGLNTMCLSGSGEIHSVYPSKQVGRKGESLSLSHVIQLDSGGL